MTDFRRDLAFDSDGNLTSAAPPLSEADSRYDLLAARLELQVTTIGLLLTRVQHLTAGVLQLAEFVDSVANAVRAGGTAQVTLLAAVEDVALRVRALELRAAGRVGAA